MVKKTTPKKAAAEAEKNVGGRPKRDPDTLRTERLVVRIHPDLMAELTKVAKENGITRSMLVERSMVSFVNLSVGEPILDNMGRRLHGAEPAGQALGTPASFNAIWKRAVGGSYAMPKSRALPPGRDPITEDPEGDED